MSDAAALAVAVLATWRLTELMTVDSISEGFRKRYPLAVFTCIRCMSVWAGLVCGIIYWWKPIVNLPLALSETYLVWQSLLAQRMQARQENGGH